MLYFIVTYQSFSFIFELFIYLYLCVYPSLYLTVYLFIFISIFVQKLAHLTRNIFIIPSLYSRDIQSLVSFSHISPSSLFFSSFHLFSSLTSGTCLLRRLNRLTHNYSNYLHKKQFSRHYPRTKLPKIISTLKASRR